MNEALFVRNQKKIPQTTFECMQKPDRGVHKGTSLCVCCDSPICLILILISWRDAIINKHGGTASKGNKVLLSLSGDLSEYLFFDMLTQNMCKWGTYWPSSVCVEYSWKCCVYAREIINRQLQLPAASPQVLSGDGNDCDYWGNELLLIWDRRQFLVRLAFAPVYSLAQPTMVA